MYLLFKEFLGFSNDTKTNQLFIEKRICTPQHFLYGGAGLSLSVQVLESHFQRPMIWTTTQFVDQASPHTLLDFEIQTGSSGKNFTQCSLNGKVDNTLIFSTIASLGSRESNFKQSWNFIPGNLPRPEDCEAIPFPELVKEYVMAQFDIRNIRGPGAFSFNSKEPDTNKQRSVFWVRIPSCKEICSSTLAFVGDIAPSITSSLLGEFVMARSLDNSIRFIEIEQTEWILCEVEAHAVNRGIGHISQRMWSQSGQLMAIASQSYILKVMDGDSFTKMAQEAAKRKNI